MVYHVNIKNKIILMAADGISLINQQQIRRWSDQSPKMATSLRMIFPWTNLSSGKFRETES